jgi:hypothetical protein
VNGSFTKPRIHNSRGVTHMARYYLHCPHCDRTIRTRGGTEEGPIYHCPGCSRLWSLSISRDHQLQRILKQYDADTGKSQNDVAAVVPQDWDGEPSRIGITQDSWSAITNPKKADTPLDLEQAAKDIIQEGNLVYLLDYDGNSTHRITVQDDQLTLIPLNAR